MPLLILIYPFAEIYAWYLFISTYSFLDALALALTGALLGILIMMTQGRSALFQAQQSFGQGQLPSQAILHRGLVILGGLLIFLPGLISKFFGFLLVLPGSRHLAVWYFKWALAGKIANGNFQIFMAGNFVRPKSQADSRARDVVEIVPNQIEDTKSEP